MDRETAKAINNISEKINEIERKLDGFFNNRCDENSSNINDVQDAICESSTEMDERIADIENALCELSESLESEVE